VKRQPSDDTHAQLTACGRVRAPYRRHAEVIMQAWGEQESILAAGAAGLWVTDTAGVLEERRARARHHAQAERYLCLLAAGAPHLTEALRACYLRPEASAASVAAELEIAAPPYADPPRELGRRVKSGLEILRAWVLYESAQRKLAGE
jgi:hypothetical protein